MVRDLTLPRTNADQIVYVTERQKVKGGSLDLDSLNVYCFGEQSLVTPELCGLAVTAMTHTKASTQPPHDAMLGALEGAGGRLAPENHRQYQCQ